MPPPPPSRTQDRGQPGYTPNERRRFNDLLSRNHLVDVFRHLHPDTVVSTWMGKPGVSTLYLYPKYNDTLLNEGTQRQVRRVCSVNVGLLLFCLCGP